MSRPCYVCAGRGCEECDQTGKRYRETLDAGNGVIFSVTGSGEGLTDEQREAFTKLMAVAYERMYHLCPPIVLAPKKPASPMRTTEGTP